LRPYQLVLDDGVCYLFGFDELRNAERIFSLVRMRNVCVTETAFDLPEDFEFSNRLENANFGAVFRQKSEHYKIEFYRLHPVQMSPNQCFHLLLLLYFWLQR